MTNIKEQRMHQIYKISNNIVIKSRGKYENLKKLKLINYPKNEGILILAQKTGGRR